MIKNNNIRMYENYQEKKAAGNFEIIKAGGGYASAVKKWDPNTGEQLAPEIVSVDTELLATQRAGLVANIADIDALLADIAALG